MWWPGRQHAPRHQHSGAAGSALSLGKPPLTAGRMPRGRQVAGGLPRTQGVVLKPRPPPRHTLVPVGHAQGETRMGPGKASVFGHAAWPHWRSPQELRVSRKASRHAQQQSPLRGGKKKEGKVCSNFPPARAESSTSHRLLARHHRPSHSSTPHGWGGDPRTFLSSSGCPPAGASITIPQVQSKIRSPVPTQGYGYG